MDAKSTANAVLLCNQVPETGVEPVRACGPQEFKSGVSTSSTTRAWRWAKIIDNKKADDCTSAFIGARNGTRTRDPNLGKVMLYQLSYSRIALAPSR